MNRLAEETLIATISLLNFSDRLQCALVCKQWHNISSNTCLYRDLKFDTNEEKLQNSIELFDEKQHYGQHVQYLYLKDCVLDMHTILTLPRFFPNLKDLEWYDVDRSFEDRASTNMSLTEYPPEQVYQRDLRKWGHINNISTALECIPFATMLLGSATFYNLTTLFVSFQRLLLDKFFYEPTMTKVRPIVKDLIKNIQNAPSLEDVHLERVVIDLEDMEILHAGAPRLQKLQLFWACVYGGETKEMSITEDGKLLLNQEGFEVVQQPASNLKDLTISFYVRSPSRYHTIELSKDAIQKWLIYISCKHTTLEEVIIDLSNYDPIPTIREFKQPLLSIIHNTSRLTYYSGQLYPITRNILQAIENSSGNLQEVAFCSDEMEQVEEQFNYLKLSRYTETITDISLYVERTSPDDAPFSLLLLDLQAHFLHLANLTTNCYIYYKELQEMLQNMPSLVYLSLDIVQIQQGDAKEEHPITTKSNVEQLAFRLNCEENVTLGQTNTALKSIFQSCPVLKEFMLEGELGYNGALNLYFFYHDRLKAVTVKVVGAQYYTFSWTDGKQGRKWADYHHLLDNRDIGNQVFHIDLAWRGDITLNLEKAPVE